VKLKTQNKVKRTIITTGGNVTYQRYTLIPADKESSRILWEREQRKSVIPLDSAIQADGLPFRMTINMMLEVARAGILSKSYQEAEDTLRHYYGVDINDDTLREVTNYIGKMIYMEDCRLAREAQYIVDSGKLLADEDDIEDDVLYIMTDGAALNTVHHVNKKDPNDSSWKENKLCVVFRQRDIRSWTDPKTGEKLHQITKREYISYTGGVDEFKWHVLALAIRNGYGRVKKTVIISDGAMWIKNMKEELFPEAQQILDLFHLKENVYEYSKALWNNDPVRYKPWSAKVCNMLDHGKWEKVIDLLKQHKDKELEGAPVNLYTYILNHKDNIDYPSYRDQGLFVGSGVIESGNKTVLQDRLKRSGMRWNVVTARYILSLKAKEQSKMWESYVIPFVRNKLLQETIPGKLPRGKNEQELLEKAELENAIKTEKQRRRQDA
jgi:hypothetical protein